MILGDDQSGRAEEKLVEPRDLGFGALADPMPIDGTETYKSSAIYFEKHSGAVKD